jgi:hypothetical protein
VALWKDICPLQPEFGPEEKHFVSGNFAKFSLYIYFVGRISEAAMGGPRSSLRVRRSSVGCSVAQKGAA